MNEIDDLTPMRGAAAYRTGKFLSGGLPIRAGTAIFWTLTVSIALASWRFFLFGVERSMEQVLYHEQLRPLVLYAHIVFAPAALLLVPFQLRQGLRKTRPWLHRLLGRLYGLSILISGVSGLWLAVTVDSGLIAATGFFFLAIAWLATTGIGIVLAMRHDYAGHRRWIIRSVAVTLSAVTLRLYFIPAEVLEIGGTSAYQAIAWLCWVPNLFVAELYLKWPKLRKSLQRRQLAHS
jgi:hypothetical protein